jgi:hypothetical protein
MLLNQISRQNPGLSETPTNKLGSRSQSAQVVCYKFCWMMSQHSATVALFSMAATRAW